MSHEYAATIGCFAGNSSRHFAGLPAAILTALILTAPDSQAGVTFQNYINGTGVFFNANLSPWSSASDNQFSWANYAAHSFDDSISTHVFDDSIECSLGGIRSGFADPLASLQFSFSPTLLLTATGSAGSSVSSYPEDEFPFDPCGTGYALVRSQGAYEIALDTDYQVTLSGTILGEGYVTMMALSVSPQEIIFQKIGPGAFNFEALLSGGVVPHRYSLGIVASVGGNALVSGNPRESGQSSFVVNMQLATPPEICDNGIDDDEDGLIDAADPDCTPPPPAVGLLVRCMHEPIYPQANEEVTITATAIDKNGDTVTADTVEIMRASLGNVVASGTNQTLAQETHTPGGSFSYGCRAVKGSETAQSWWLGDPRLRSVDVGGANNPDWEAQPVLYNGPDTHKIDIVFFHDDDEYDSYTDPLFIQDVHDLIDNGLWSIPWFVENQWAFNFWIARADGADASPEPGPIPAGQNVPDCNRQNTSAIRNIFNKKYKFRDAGAIVHRSNCRDSANVPRTFTIQANRPLVLPHEMGHRPFGMADEYCRVVGGGSFCDGGHHQNNPFANMYRTENGCRDGAVDRPYDADDCRLLTGANGYTWWLGEPPYANLSFSSQPRDLMQQTGSRETAPGSGIFVAAYAVGLTEITRMNWYVQKCIEGKC